MIEYQLPDTEQGLHDFIRFALREIKSSDLKIKKLNKMIDACHIQLTIKGQGLQARDLLNQGEENAKHVQTV